MTLGVTVASRYAEALMLRARKRNVTLIVVEGSSDSRLYRKVLKPDSTHILWLNGKDEALSLLTRFQTTKIRGNLGIVDGDLDRLNGKKRQTPDVIWTSENDMETMVLRSEAFYKALASSDRTELSKKREMLLEATVQLGCLRALSQQEDWALDFKNLNIASFVDSVRVSSDIGALCEEIIRKNPQFDLSAKELSEEVETFTKLLSDISLVYHGHDLCRFMEVCRSRLFGSTPVSFETFASNFNKDDFAVTKMHSELLLWEKNNPDFSGTTI